MLRVKRLTRHCFVLATAVALLFTASAQPALAWPPEPPPAGESQKQLSALRVAPPGSGDGYSRDRFPHWSGQGDGCDTREVVLQRDGVDVVTDGDCRAVSGSWYSVYDQVWVRDSSDVHIDHMVPLANAWRSGAADWTDAKRGDYANGLDRGELIAVSAASNRAKGDQNPAQWRPANRGWWCMYARHWINVKHHWELTITGAEKSALEEMLETC